MGNLFSNYHGALIGLLSIPTIATLVIALVSLLRARIDIMNNPFYGSDNDLRTSASYILALAISTGVLILPMLLIIVLLVVITSRDQRSEQGIPRSGLLIVLSLIGVVLGGVMVTLCYLMPLLMNRSVHATTTSIIYVEAAAQYYIILMTIYVSLLLWSMSMVFFANKTLCSRTCRLLPGTNAQQCDTRCRRVSND